MPIGLAFLGGALIALYVEHYARDTHAPSPTSAGCVYGG